jgi:hypothetical protein
MGFGTIVAAKVKDGLYCHPFSMDMFLFLIIKVFECLMKRRMNE